MLLSYINIKINNLFRVIYEQIEGKTLKLLNLKPFFYILKMNTKELRKLLKDNGFNAYTYWGKDKLINQAKINNLLPEQEELKPKEEPKPEQEEPENISWQKQKQIRKKPVNVKFIDMETKEIKAFDSIYKAAQYLDKSPQTIRHYGLKKGIWKKKYQIIINEE